MTSSTLFRVNQAKMDSLVGRRSCRQMGSRLAAPLRRPGGCLSGGIGALLCFHVAAPPAAMPLTAAARQSQKAT